MKHSTRTRINLPAAMWAVVSEKPAPVDCTVKRRDVRTIDTPFPLFAVGVRETETGVPVSFESIDATPTVSAIVCATVFRTMYVGSAARIPAPAAKSTPTATDGVLVSVDDWPEITPAKLV